jgi:hypothetical protein
VVTVQGDLAIRKRDVQAERCARCLESDDHLSHTETLAECEARVRKQSNGKRGCWEPEQHHPYEPGGIATYEEYGAADRRALLALVDELAGAARPVMGTLNFYIGPAARTSVSHESIERYRRLADALAHVAEVVGPPIEGSKP